MIRFPTPSISIERRCDSAYQDTPEWHLLQLAETQAKVDSGELQFEDWDKVKAELREEFDRKWK